MNETPPDAAQTVWPLPDRRHLVLLAVGAVVGILLGPLVLGQVSPSTYQSLFIGDTQRAEFFQREVERVNAELENLESVAANIDVTPAAVEEMRDSLLREKQLAEMSLEVELSQLATGESIALLIALVLALLVVAIFEATISPKPSERGRAVLTPVQQRVTTIRYALLAGVLALVLARPALLAEVSWVFVVLLLAVIAVAGFVPLGRRSSDS
ncbi:MAG: hypothetical protein ACOC1G_07305 [Phycisphaeraceae bacterium]